MRVMKTTQAAAAASGRNKGDRVPDDEFRATNLVSPTRRAISLLQALVDSGGEATLNDLAEKIRLAPSTVHRLASLLQTDGLLRKDERLRRYLVGDELYRLSARVQHLTSPAAIAAPFLESLSNETGHVALLGWYLRGERRFSFIVASSAPGPSAHRIELNTPFLLFRGAAGKVIMAHLQDDDYVQVYSEAERYLDGDPKDLLSQLQKVHSDGCLLTMNERVPGAAGIAAPVFAVGEKVVGSVSLVIPFGAGPLSSVPARLPGAVREHARRLSHTLGASWVPRQQPWKREAP